MTDLLDHAIARTRTLPQDVQDEAARMLLLFAGEDGPLIQLTPEEEADLREADAEIARGEFATEEEVKAVRAKYRL
jgi:predicted transcriptional regulator